ncbi:ABC transporter permease subunit [Actinomadura sp. NEAU-AAG7]|uniref:ABC transporter permease subunit n=1 Tax=Actinomadura sp. NEAU-AAG7 TaxID=2839640 RepID=UPI001BE4D34D|nr:ABC transporter permease subunit [Actinomadura sp. NEAU-AAG7]MBT2211901.1 ABC transporter permease subunit [Actinomadura sp. NEAU-AAG7]
MTAPYRSTVLADARDGFGRLLAAEWTKLATVPRWRLALAASVLLTVAVAVLTAAGSQTTGGGGPPARLRPLSDQGRITYQTLPDDGALTARVTAQGGGGGWAKAGLIIRADLRPGTPYAAIAVTPGHGVRLLSGYRDGGPGGAPGTPPAWLRLTRAGTTVTGYASPDGRTWRRVGAVELDAPGPAAAGLFVAAPDRVEVQRQFGGESISGTPADTRASFDNVTLTAAGGAPVTGPWRDRGGAGGPAAPDPGGTTRTGGTITLAGSGDIGPDAFADDVTRTTLTGALVGQAAIVALAVLFVTVEYRRATIRLTLAASPRRGRVLAAKATVVGLAVLAAGLAAAFGSLLAARPVLRAHGTEPPPLTDPAVLRAAVGTAVLMAVVAVLGVATATILRRGAPAITLVLLVLLVPQIVATGLPVAAARWLQRLTPAAGFAVQHTVRRYDTPIGAFAGLGVLCLYTAAALAAAAWLLRRRDA